VVTDNKQTAQLPVHPLHAHLSRSSESLNCFRRDRAQPGYCRTAPTKGVSVDYVPTPDVTLGVSHLRVPSTKWEREDLKRISQWKSEPQITSWADEVEQWELEIVASQLKSSHCYFHLFLGVEASHWKGILTDYHATDQRMLKLLTIWHQKYDGRRKGLVSALHSLHLDELADQ